MRVPVNHRSALWLVFFLNGSVLSSWAPRIPSVKDELALSNAELGVALLGIALGSVPALLVTGRLLRRVPARTLCRASGFAFAAALPLIAAATDLATLALALLTLGAASGVLDVAMNAAAVQLERARGSSLLPGLHGAYSLGVLCGSGAGALAAGQLPVATHFATVTAVLLGALALVWRAIPGGCAGHETADHGGKRRGRVAPGLVIFAVCALLIEGIVTDWSAVLVREELGGTATLAGLAVTVFSAAMATSRTLGDRLVNATAPATVARLGAALTMVALLASLAQPHPLVFIALLVLVGLGTGPLFPLAISVAATRATIPLGSVTATLTAWAYLAYLTGPPAVGTLAETTGLRGSLATIGGIAALAMLILSFLAVRRPGSPQPRTTPAGVEAPDQEGGIMADIHEVPATGHQARELYSTIEPARAATLREAITSAGNDRTIWHINSTAHGGGVAEMLRSAISYARGWQITQRWLVITPPREFFAVTKRLDNGISGIADSLPLDRHDQAIYAETSRRLAASLERYIAPGDVVILHDPQTAGLAQRARALGALVLWRFHNGNDHPNPYSTHAWEFLAGYLNESHGIIATLPQFVPPLAFRRPIAVIPPFIDPASPKNEPLDREQVRAILAEAGLITGQASPGAQHAVTLRADITRDGPPPHQDTPMILQVGRWDPVKDMLGVLRAFHEHLAPDTEATLTLAGPAVDGVADDPDAGREFRRCVEYWRSLDPEVRSRIQLACLPMDDPIANATVVNALQRHATVVVQKSLSEGFGLTLTEAMWKAKPVVASGVGGLRYQLGYQPECLVDDPDDLATFAHTVRRFLAEPDSRAEAGQRGWQRVYRDFLPDSHLCKELEFTTGLRNEVLQ
ncbi:MFS transporter [Haloechinothrix sp. LS1_15]|uniref:MFS transporter n=1 Tax=Haloechinothrix sp. LS1_15 TaxID=2652248 RepID=UPI0029484CF8|nr:MFS transporter [Haloechinothrix sp. LS1_15]MDV6012435.1 MFS transporter [Haloechinothrix sp. LS1_15]